MEKLSTNLSDNMEGFYQEVLLALLTYTFVTSITKWNHLHVQGPF